MEESFFVSLEILDEEKLENIKVMNDACKKDGVYRKYFSFLIQFLI